MDIVHLYKDYHPVLGGIENHIRVVAEAQAQAGHRVTVLVCDASWRTRQGALNGVHVIRAGRMGTFASMPLSLSQPLALARLRPDLVHVHSPYPLGEVANWLLGRGKATVITHHSDVVRQRGWLRLYAPLLRRVLSAADCIIATNPPYLETSRWLQPVRDRCVVVPLGVDVTRFTPPAAIPPCNPLRLLFVGRLRYYKGLDVLLKALVNLPNVGLTVVGDGPQRAAWHEQAYRLGLSERVTFVGDVPDAALPDYYRAAHGFVLPATARAEAFGTVLLEAMACGLPCVTTELGTGTSWIVQDQITGWVVPPNDVEALAGALAALVANDTRRRQFGLAGRTRVEQHFSQEHMLRGIDAVYQRVLPK